MHDIHARIKLEVQPGVGCEQANIFQHHVINCMALYSYGLFVIMHVAFFI